MTIRADTQITELTVNDHACLTFGEAEELLDLTAAFVRDGLDGGLKVVWLSDAAPGRAAAELARRGVAVESALASGQLAAAGYEGRLLTGQVFSASDAASWLAHETMACRDQGFPGLRLAVDMGWALRPVTGVEQLPEFEEKVAAALGGATVSVLCQYDRERFEPGHAGLCRRLPHPLGRGRDLLRRRDAADLPPVRTARHPPGRGARLPGQ